MEYVFLIVALLLIVATFVSVRFPAPAQAGEVPRVEMARTPPAEPAPAGGGPRWQLLGWLVLLLAIVVVVALLAQSQVVLNLVHLLVLCRYSLATAALLVGLVPLGLTSLPSLLRNLFVLRSP